MPAVYYDHGQARRSRRDDAQKRVRFAGPNSPPRNGPVAISSAARELMQSSVAPATRARKRRSVKRFLDWAEEEGYTAGQVLPPSEELLCNYAASFKGSVAGDTARAHLSTIKSWVVHKGHAWQGMDRLRDVLGGVERHAPASSLREQRPPVKESDIDKLRTGLTLQGESAEARRDRCVFAMASSPFYGQMRLGEVAPPCSSAAAYDSSAFPTVASLSRENNDGARILHLGKTKVEQRRGEDVIIAPQPGESSPTKALRRHIRSNALSPSDPLFAYRLQDGSLQVLTKKEFLHRVNQVWSSVGVRRFTGHCFRIGGTTHFLINGVAPEVVKTMGRWKSNAFLKYWRNLETLAVLHLHRTRVQNAFHDRLCPQ